MIFFLEISMIRNLDLTNIFKDAHALIKIIAGYMRRFGPEVVLPPDASAIF